MENESYLHRASARHFHPQRGSQEVESHFGLTDCLSRTQTDWNQENRRRRRPFRLCPWHWQLFCRRRLPVWFLWWREWNSSTILWRRKGKRVDKTTVRWEAEREQPWPLAPWQVSRLWTNNGFNGLFKSRSFYYAYSIFIFNISSIYILSKFKHFN